MNPSLPTFNLPWYFTEPSAVPESVLAWSGTHFIFPVHFVKTASNIACCVLRCPFMFSPLGEIGHVVEWSESRNENEQAWVGPSFDVVKRQVSSVRNLVSCNRIERCILPSRISVDVSWQQALDSVGSWSRSLDQCACHNLRAFGPEGAFATKS